MKEAWLNCYFNCELKEFYHVLHYDKAIAEINAKYPIFPYKYITTYHADNMIEERFK